MRHCLALCGAAALFLSPVLAESLLGQQQEQPQPQRPGVQVGVPDGRGGAPADQLAVADARPGLPPAPAPRNADGRAIFSHAGKKGVWLPGGGGGAAPNATGPRFRFSRGHERSTPIAERTSSSRTRGASPPAACVSS